MMPPATPSATRLPVPMVAAGAAVPSALSNSKRFCGRFAPITPPTKWTPSILLALTCTAGSWAAPFRPMAPPTQSPVATMVPVTLGVVVCSFTMDAVGALQPATPPTKLLPYSTAPSVAPFSDSAVQRIFALVPL